MSTGSSHVETLAINTHMGRVVANGGARTMIRELDPDLVGLYEVTAKVLDDLHRQIGSDYALIPSMGRSKNGRSGNVTAIRRQTMNLQSRTDRRLSSYRDDMHPERRLTVVSAKHIYTTRPVAFVPVHAWAMGAGWGSPPGVVRGHVRQVRRVAAACERPARSVAVLAAGDWNEDLDAHIRGHNAHRTAVAQMAKARMVPAHQLLDQHGSTSLEGPALLDDVFHRLGGPLKLTSRLVLDIPGRGDDHRAVLTRHRITRP